MKLYEFYTRKQTLCEGGNAFNNVSAFDHELVPHILKLINKVIKATGANAIPIGSGANPTPGKQMGDLDIIVDQEALSKFFKQSEASAIRKALRARFDQAGFNTAQSGVSVHVSVPVAGHHHQVDVMVVPNANNISKFHKHNIPPGSQFKGVHKQQAIAHLAKQRGLMWSGFQGLFKRDANGKKSQFITDDPDRVAQLVLGKHASSSDLASVETIAQALPDDQAQQLIQHLESETQR